MLDLMLLMILLTAVAIFFGGLYVVFNKQNPGWGPRNVQALGLVTVLPIILILAGMGKIENAVVATLLGAVVGFILGGRGRSDKDD